ncbi:cell wall hydrolase [Sphingomonas sp. KR1UV-12]|uniref:Cell wall hydrolase n=1 Tax=Sphingomonas aurea TaxID=3063994 RepID=A0ABT9EHI8_9SPHN|nr:cell wall hydrolase [Sphingomonas sp. KR1UV-12]MDP1026442.1 cell wall hydrolase [Sphingomonas sp. KR1UV-12]
MSPQPKPGARPSGAIRAILSLIAGTAVVVPAFVVATAPPPAVARARKAVPPRRVVPPTVLPAVEPVELVDLSPDEARAYNADVPFARGANPAARPFRLRDAPEDLARATDCLAAAMLYEAGADPVGQKAVAQVVLNRVRHPAFPKTVCGVVFEGQDRRTGCQFTFTCDGALTRWQPPAALWTRARTLAAAALAGTVYRPVGYATHYHTDWVVPYWQSSLDKIAGVGTHLFFRWAGWWGTPPAFNRQVQASEPVIAKLAPFSDAHKTGAAVEEAKAAMSTADLVTALTAGTPAAAAPGEPDSFLVVLPAGAQPESFPQLAQAVCGTRDHCKYLGWTDAKSLPKSGAPDPTQLAAMAFSYLRDRPAGLERTLWNCTLYPRTRPGGCMKRQPVPAPTPAPTSAVIAPVAKGPAELGGVRRGAPAPTPNPNP